MLQRTFADRIRGRCEADACAAWVCGFRCHIVAPAGYRPGEPDVLRVVCPEHARLEYHPPGAFVTQWKPSHLLVETWLHRAGFQTHAPCALCSDGAHLLTPWAETLELCHVHPRHAGGLATPANLVLGHAACNRQQGPRPVVEYRASLGLGPEVAAPVVPADRLASVRASLTALSRIRSGTDPVKRAAYSGFIVADGRRPPAATEQP